jgi:hypothetical protein
MTTRDIAKTLATLFSELAEGTPPSGGYVLNAGDRGLLQSLDRLSAGAASTTTRTGSSVAAHVEHVRYGLSLMNRWGAGENPFGDADWGAAWRKTQVSEAEWRMLRDQLRHEATRWLEALRTPRDVDEDGLNGMIGSIAHFAYHVGAIRQIDQLAIGPPDTAR